MIQVRVTGKWVGIPRRVAAGFEGSSNPEEVGSLERDKEGMACLMIRSSIAKLLRRVQ